MFYMILLLTVIGVLFYYQFTKPINEHFSGNDKKGVNEGTLSYHRRLFTKYIHRPANLRWRDAKKTLSNNFARFKRHYL